ncbi:hypothetical protein Zmor_018141 [Zophobas morio]|uniref:Uncharacterized protein n=1 Tax=Zophobas morio TaxID=2755281 RepID=A0AA38ICQ3_9CUCU|nr:hypothetical protein Zmor_018141 [Zophobas morio]
MGLLISVASMEKEANPETLRQDVLNEDQPMVDCDECREKRKLQAQQQVINQQPTKSQDECYDCVDSLCWAAWMSSNTDPQPHNSSCLCGNCGDCSCCDCGDCCDCDCNCADDCCDCCDCDCGDCGDCACSDCGDCDSCDCF